MRPVLAGEEGLMATNEQIRNTYATVEAMVNGASQVMQRLHPDMKMRSWNELTLSEQRQMAQAFHAMLPPLATILSGKVTSGENDTGVTL